MKSSLIIPRFPALLAVCAIALVPVFASPARMSGMGMQTDTYWMIQGDDTIISYNPAELSLFAPEIWVRIKQPTTYGCGVILGLAPKTNLYINTGLPLSLTGFANKPPVLSLTQEQLNLMVSFPVDKMYIGFSGSVSNVYYNDTTPPDEDKNNALVWNLGAGLLFDLNATASVDAAVKATSNGIDSDLNGTNVYDAHTYDLAAFARLNWKRKPTNTIHIALAYSYLDRSYTQAALPEVESIIHGLTAGLSGEFKITAKTLLYAGAQGAFTQSQATAGDTREIQVKIAGGMESALSEKILLRFGANRLLFNREENPTNYTEQNTEGKTNLNIGIGLTLGELVFDLDVNKKLLSDGPDFISGAGPGPWSADLVATYYLDGKKPKTK